ncbi:MAG: histidine phosphatase family protein [Clostridia bacterium]|nr:histidine phosphatase family protein [Clostridia bacterium]
MVKLYIVRHCESLGNEMNIFQGTTDLDISTFGEKQLSFLEARFKDIHIDKAYSSPLTRAYKTALAATKGKNIEIVKDESFIEIHAGKIENENIEKVFALDPILADIWHNRPQDFKADCGEAMREVYNRVWKGFEKIATSPENDRKTILIASHGAAIRCLICRLLFGSIERLAETPWSLNTAVSLITYCDGVYKIEFANDASHLPKEYNRNKLRILSVKNEE